MPLPFLHQDRQCRVQVVDLKLETAAAAAPISPIIVAVIC